MQVFEGRVVLIKRDELSIVDARRADRDAAFVALWELTEQPVKEIKSRIRVQATSLLDAAPDEPLGPELPNVVIYKACPCV